MSSSNNITIVEKPRLYVGCGLTLAPQSFIDNVELLKKRLGKEWRVLDFLGLTAGTAADVYQRDIAENVGTCHAFIGIADEPSIGLGYELAIATEKMHKPVLATAKAGARITRLLLGAAEMHENMIFKPYENMVEDVPALAREVFAHVLGSGAVGPRSREADTI